MPIENVLAGSGLYGTYAMTRKGITGSPQVGVSRSPVNLPLATEGVTFEVIVDGTNTVEIALDDFAVNLTGAGVAQVETATVVGTVTVSGSMQVAVTSPLLDDNPTTITFSVTNGDTASDVATEMRSALSGFAAITDHFTVGGAGANVTLTANVAARNDTTFNIAYSNLSASGITPDATSTDTTAGVEPAACYSLPGVSWASDNFEGGSVPGPAVFYGMEIAVDSTSSEGVVAEIGAFYADYIGIGEVTHKHSASAAGIGISDPSQTLTFTGQGAYCKALVTLMFSTS